MPAQYGRNGAKKGEKVPLLKPWKDDDAQQRENGVGVTRNGWHALFGFLKHTFIPAFIFSLTSGIFMVGYHQNPHLLQAAAVFFTVAFLSDMAFQHRLKNRMHKNAFIFGLCAFAVFSGAIVGTSIHLTELLDYWPYYQKRHYTNVAPDEPAASKADASVIVFMEGARPDGSREIGYRRNGNTYCVAPIAVEAGYSDVEAPNSEIQYWAIGENCCGGVAGFTCDDAANPKARSGLVMQQLSGEDKIGEGIMSSDVFNFYEKAVKMSLTKFDITSPEERLYVRFVQDIDKARMGYWTHAWGSWTKFQFLWLIVWTAGGIIALLMGAGDKEDPDNYAEHMIDARQSALHKLNHYI